eukprot:CAMPEP_0117675266 /NCGR_PEP_ID=MMETSP0804-20121206/15509_1 /TAXON_ID=1074897 /ORGANISM="Tetraselmis astigmatica, Strain CCMP880" /LENGTH=510 /DNA_ID=CAMNT_0005484249 /DNA_START=233 /DNA_END=1766 /DNA_ORIENTATION=+
MSAEVTKSGGTGKAAAEDVTLPALLQQDSQEQAVAENVTMANPLVVRETGAVEDPPKGMSSANYTEPGLAAAESGGMQSASSTPSNSLPVAEPVVDSCEMSVGTEGDKEAGKVKEKRKRCDPCRICCCSWSRWNLRCSGEGALFTWTCIVCSLFWVALLTAMLIIYLPRLFFYDQSTYVCPAAAEESVPATSGYQLVEEYSGATFLDGWTFFTADDPTQGYVNFVSKEYASQNNLSYYDEATGLFYLKTDDTNVVPEGARGRDSIRLHSDRNFTYGVFIAGVRHMPEGCGTWPAWWMMQDPWPEYGEIDIIENINREGRNSLVGHTKGVCDVPAPQDSFQGVWKPAIFPPLQPSTDCALDTNPQGCAQHQPPGTASKPFNEQGGGVHALVWDEAGIRSYFWSYSCGGPPADVVSNSPVPSTWGKPMARFDFNAGKCLADSFRELYMVINLTYCGTWAGSSGWLQCIFDKGFSCDGFVKNNPQAFEEAFWAWEYVKVFQLLNSTADAVSPS